MKGFTLVVLCKRWHQVSSQGTQVIFAHKATDTALSGWRIGAGRLIVMSA